MEEILTQLSQISNALDTMHERMKEDARIEAEELAERQRLGLTGEEAVKHYHDWMSRHKN